VILRSTFAQAPDYPFVIYLEVSERLPLIAEVNETFGPGGMLPHSERHWVCGTARVETMQEAGVFAQSTGGYIAFRQLEDQVLFRLKYQGRLKR
jgi:hypothetical protein